ncbi:MAG: helix-turn-helix domain-containing protein [Moorellales bacterium]
MAANGSRLAILMDRLEISGKELARILNVHSSLVSKWRNGSRPLHPRSPYLGQIVDYFLSVDSARKYDTIRDILGADYPDANLDSKAALSALLARWLCGSPAEGGPALARVGGAARYRLYRVPVELYRGNEGRREVMLHLLELTGSLLQGQELLIFGDEDPSWLLEEASFAELWRDKLSEALSRSAELTVVHTSHRDPGQDQHLR